MCRYSKLLLRVSSMRTVNAKSAERFLSLSSDTSLQYTTVTCVFTEDKVSVTIAYSNDLSNGSDRNHSADLALTVLSEDTRNSSVL
jgi:hypothetical protein